MRLSLDPGFWAGRRVLLTGHTGFKGSWCALWLKRLGAHVTGFALPADTQPNLFEGAEVGRDLVSLLGDIRDPDAIARAVAEADPEIVLHLAAQPLVRAALREPLPTWAINVMGTAHLLEALRAATGLRAVLIVTTDKVYRNEGEARAFVEGDPLGGRDPYSASKAAAEMVACAMGQSYFELRNIAVATARGGNVIGGGDYAEDRLVPDILRALRRNESPRLRYPAATRPWQHVIDCLHGYLVYTQALALERGTGSPRLPRALNIGPGQDGSFAVHLLAEHLLAAFGSPATWQQDPGPHPPEVRSLAIDATLLRDTFGVAERLPGTAALEATAAWYRAVEEGHDMRSVTLAQIDSFMTSS